MGKKKRGYSAEPKEPSRLDRLFANRAFAIGAGLIVVGAFAGLAVLVVTWFGGDELSAGDANLEPTDVVAPAVYERSSIADVFGTKTWDEMTSDEQETVETEIRRVFDNSTFRASSDVIVAFDVHRVGGETLFSRQYIETETPGGDLALAETMYMHCRDDNDRRVTYRLIVTPVESLLSEDIDEAVQQPAWDAILDGTNWSGARDLGFKESTVTGRRLHGLDLPFALNPAQVEKRPTEYWFDAESAQLAERAIIVEGDEASTEGNWYYLSYDQLPPVIIPSTIEKPACVEGILRDLPF